jgi:hypothetical protein
MWLLGHDDDQRVYTEEVTGLKLKREENLLSSEPYPLHTYGTIDCGLETMTEAWPNLEHVFSSGGIQVGGNTIPLTGGRLPHNLLEEHPIDLLVVDQGHMNRPPGTTTSERPSKWEQIVQNVPDEVRPKVVIESWPEKAIGWMEGPMAKSARIRWRKLGYVSRFQRVDATTIGGAIEQACLLVIRITTSIQHLWMWRTKDLFGLKRPMSNLLTPPGLVSSEVLQSTALTIH